MYGLILGFQKTLIMWPNQLQSAELGKLTQLTNSLFSNPKKMEY